MAKKKRRKKPLTRWQRFWRWLTERPNYAGGAGPLGNGGGNGGG